MHKKFFRISVLTLGSALCILPATQSDGHAMKVVNASDGIERMVGFSALLRYQDEEGDYKAIPLPFKSRKLRTGEAFEAKNAQRMVNNALNFISAENGIPTDFRLSIRSSPYAASSGEKEEGVIYVETWSRSSQQEFLDALNKTYQVDNALGVEQMWDLKAID